MREVVAIELPSKVNHSNYTVLLRSDGASATLRYFRNGSKENGLHDEALKRCIPGTYLRMDSCGAPQRMSYTFFFPSNCHTGLLTVCAEARVTPQPEGQTRIVKVPLLEPNNPRLRAVFFCLGFFLEAA